MPEKNFPLLCLHCLQPFIIKKIVDVNTEIKQNKKRSEVICPQCGITLKEAMRQKLKGSNQ